MNILGISAFYHDSAASLIKDGVIVAAAQEERFTRKKHDAAFPSKAIEYCFKEASINTAEIDYVVFYDKPFLKFDRILETYLAYAPKGLKSFIQAIPLWIKKKIWIKDIISKELKDFKGKILFPEHHQSHAASAFFASPFHEAAFLTVDGVGEWTTTSYGVGQGNKIKISGELKFPHSLGLLYSAFTYYNGFKVNSGEYKMMGLAPYGQPKFYDLILRELVDLKEDGSFRLNMEYFNYPVGLTMTNKKFGDLFGAPARKSESEISQHYKDVSASIQKVTEEIVLRMARYIKKQTNQKYLCLAGGVALNCVANGKLLRENLFEDIWIQPAAGDAGGALGAALLTWYQYLDNSRTADNINDFQKGSYLGPEFTGEHIQKYLDKNKIPYQKLSNQEIPEKIADLIAKQEVIGWFQGKMEFGPRALGSRSILGDARSPEMQKTMNLKIKFRESFRPFAPVAIEERASDYFDIDRSSPYMLLVTQVKNEHETSLPAITHVDNSARLQTTNSTTNPLYHAMIKKFDEKHNCPVVINTSFNVRGEPIVCTPQDAYLCFMRTNMDYLIMGDYLLNKKEQPELKDDVNWRDQYELD